MHADQLTVTVDAVRDLVDAQFPAWRRLPIRQLHTEGTVNAIFRIGDQLAARFPLRPADVDTTHEWLTAEAEASRELLGRSRFPVPEPVAIGRPGPGFPLPWSVQSWLPGVTASVEDPGRSIRFAHDLAEFVSDVRAIGTRGRTFNGRGRGGDLPSHDDWMETCFEKSEALFDVAELRRLWRKLRVLPRVGPDVMTHGDLIPGNVLVSEGRLAGVLDVGGLGPADPALDLVGAWHLLEAPTRRLFRDDLGCDDVEWERGKAWAFRQAMGAAWYYQQTNPAMSRMGRRTLRRITADTSPM
jgi:aminoglycoside phosphotransferase (APT) family kinase protein